MPAVRLLVFFGSCDVLSDGWRRLAFHDSIRLLSWLFGSEDEDEDHQPVMAGMGLEDTPRENATSRTQLESGRMWQRRWEGRIGKHEEGEFEVR